MADAGAPPGRGTESRGSQRMSSIDQRAVQIVHAALGTDPSERAAFIDASCGDEAALREVVETLLRKAAPLDEAYEGEDDAPDDPLINTRLGPFRITERIGHGGMGVVYKAEREADDVRQTVAIKLIRRGIDTDDVHARFLRERRILARLNHPNLARFIDGGMTGDGRPWFALEYVPGESIKTWCDRNRLGIRERVRLALDMLSAVQYAHAQLVVHRDLKPGNVLVEASGQVRLLDFGISRLLDDDEHGDGPLTGLTQRHALTPEYAAPELIAGEPSGVASDVYPLGVIVHELITGTRPYPVDRQDLAATSRMLRSAAPISLAATLSRHDDGTDKATERLAARNTTLRGYRATVRGDLNNIVAKALAFAPIDRYASVEAMAADLERWLAGQPVAVSGHGWRYHLGKFVTRNAGAVAVTTILIAALIAALVFAIDRAYREQQQREAAQAELRRSDAVRDYIALMFRSAGEREDLSQVSAREVLAQGAERIFEQIRDAPENNLATALMVAELFIAMGDIDGATALLKRLLALPEIATDPDVHAMASYDLAQMQVRVGDLDAAMSSLETAQAIWRQRPAVNVAQINASQVVRAQVMRARMDLISSQNVLRDLIEEREKLLPEPDEPLATAYVALANTYMQILQLDQAEAAANRALSIFDELGNRHSANALGAMNTRAMALMAQGRSAEAEQLYRQIIAARREFFGESSLDLAVLTVGLASSLLGQKRSDEAIPLFKQGMAMTERHGGVNTHSMMASHLGLARAYSMSGEHAEALVEFERLEEVFGDKNDYQGIRAAVQMGRIMALIGLARLDEAHGLVESVEQAVESAGPAGVIVRARLNEIRRQLNEAEATGGSTGSP